MVPELKKRSNFVKPVQLLTECQPHWKFDLILCGSVLEFCNLDITLPYLRQILSSEMIVVSPMDTPQSRWYFKAIGNTFKRHSQAHIVERISHYFKIEEYKEWMGLYFALKATLK